MFLQERMIIHTVYLNDNGKTSKIWVYNLQDKETDW